MNTFFDVVEPLPPSELLANYWHFLKTIGEHERAKLGPIEIILKSRVVARGWPVALRSQTLALMNETELSPKSAMTFVDVSEVNSVSFSTIHHLASFITAGAVARSPLDRRPTQAEAKKHLLAICEDIRKVWSTKIYFDADPTQNSVDELTNLNEAMIAILRALESFRSDPVIWAELQKAKGLHVCNVLDMKDIAITRRENGDIELAFRFSRALPKGLDEKILLLFSAVF